MGGRTAKMALFADTLSAVPIWAVTPLVRPWHMRWGATKAEVAAAMAGDDIVRRAQFNATRAVTIEAPPEQVWPWIAQLGYRDDRTRLITRMKQDYRWQTPRLAMFNLILVEFGDFAMERRMLKGIKARAERVK
jgi:hypothetical protein